MANEGVTPPDFTTLEGNVRNLVGDTDSKPLTPPVAGLGEYAWYSDAELAALGKLMDDNPKRVAVWVLSQVAISQALLLKKWTTDDLAVDGPAITAAIERTIARLSKEIEAGEGYFDIVGGVDYSGWPHREASAHPCGCSQWGGSCGCILGGLRVT